MDGILEKHISDANLQISLGNHRAAINIVYRADRRLVSLLLGAETPQRYDDLCSYQYRLTATYLSALYREQCERSALTGDGR
jgi:hypothetical protein